MTRPNQIVIAILLGCAQAQTTSDLELDDTLASCLKFAAFFDNTCTDTSNAPASVADVPAVTMTCAGIGNCPNHGTGDDTSCSFTRKLCVSCKEESSKVYITTQTNNMPSHCFTAHLTQPQEKNYMYKARWLAPVSSSRRRALQEFTEAPEPLRNLQPSGDSGPSSGGGTSGGPGGTDIFSGLFGGEGNSPSSTTATDAVPIVNTQEDVNSLICNIMRSQDSSIPSESEYSNVSGENVATAWGVATSGMMIYNGISGEDVDPFYPKAYGKCTNAADCVERVDKCLSHPEMTGGLHYHIASTCSVDPTWDDNIATEATYESDQEDILADVRDAWDVKPYRAVFGLSKDGRPIYGPYYDNLKEYGDCYVDICNGRMINGHYSYVSTMFHPYVQGCYGPGNNPPYSQQCSSNPRKCGVLVVEGSSILRTSVISIALSLAIYINTIY